MSPARLSKALLVALAVGLCLQYAWRQPSASLLKGAIASPKLQASTASLPQRRCPRTLRNARMFALEGNQREAAPKDIEYSRRSFVSTSGAAAAGMAAMSLSQPQSAQAAKTSAWERLPLPIADNAVLFDVDFTNDKTGFLVGSQGTFLQTNDGGFSWKPANLDRVVGADEDINYRWESVSFRGSEGWAVGKPAIMIHSTDGGETWDRIPFSSQLPGDFLAVTALGESEAEVITSVGAIYRTSNGGKNWKAQVLETIDATLNRVSSSGVSGASYYSGTINSVVRDSQGQYIGVNARGNFYLTFKPGSDAWMPHNRKTIRRIVTMGVLGDDLTNSMWMTTRAGGVAFVKGDANLETPEIDFTDTNINSGGYGLLDVTRRANGDIWSVGGGGKIFLSRNGGKSWITDNSGDNQPANFYKIKFFGDNDQTGFILGSAGVLMKFQPNA